MSEYNDKFPSTRPDGFPRRSDYTLMTKEESTLFDIMQTIDCMPGNTTNIVILLNEARDLLADYLEGKQHFN